MPSDSENTRNVPRNDSAMDASMAARYWYRVGFDKHDRKPPYWWCRAVSVDAGRKVGVVLSE